MLSRVVAKMAKYPHMESFEQVHDLFVLVPPDPPMHETRISCIIISQKGYHSLSIRDYEDFVNVRTSG